LPDRHYQPILDRMTHQQQSVLFVAFAGPLPAAGSDIGFTSSATVGAPLSAAN
jgi:hypothetical protein